MSNVAWDFSGRVVAVTGSASGMGADAVRAFAAAGAEVYGLDIDEERGSEVAAGAGARFLRCDVTDAAPVEAAFDRIEQDAGRLDVLINNAGGFWHQHTTETLPTSEWDAVVDLNLKGVFLCTRRAMPLLRRSPAGRIITLSSLAGQTAVYRSSPAYAAAKAGVLALSRVFAYELAPDGVTSNAIAPSAVMTDRIREVRGPDERARTEAAIPLGRYGTTGEIVNWMMFLASDEAAYMTGQTVTVNGGRFMA
ncbi:MAG: SDR family NAD(P)-dependent oxidoreductase [Acidimicrobiaceae bacterium]|nr:SDR family NAD(P)-dependent oxidoreductase [Acidimicrobiaceae bacterium]